MSNVDQEHADAHGPREMSALTPSERQYVDEVRAATARLSVRSSESEGVRGALAVLEDVAVVDVDVPVMSRSRGGRYVKSGVKVLAGWYLRYLGQQVTTLGRATTDLGTALVERADHLEAQVGRLEAQVGRLEGQVGRLEHAGPALADLEARVAALELR